MIEKNSSEPLAPAILNCLVDGLFVTDRKGLITRVNDAALKMLGITKDAALGQSLHDTVHLTRPGSHAQVRLPSPRVFYKEASPRYFTRMLLTHAPQQPVVEAVLSPLRCTDDHIDGSVLVIRDISDALQQQKEIHERQRIEAIAGISGNLAMEFENWLNVISGHAASVSENLIPNTHAHDAAIHILEAIEHAGNLTKRLTSIASANTDGEETALEEVDLAEAINDAMEIMSHTLTDRAIDVKTKNLDSAPFVMSNMRQLLDAMINLLMNAADAMPDGGTISIDTSEKTLDDEAFAVIRVRDTGEGMPRQVVARIFDPFYTTREAGSAIGLGLTVVQSVVRSWGGSVRVRSRQGHGTSFRLFIPKLRDRNEGDQGPDVQGKTILIADDSEELLEEASTILRQAGYTVHSVSSGAECIAMYEQHADSIHLSIIDVVMPDMDGTVVLSRIRQLDSSAPVIMSSGFCRDYIRGYLKHGTWGFVQKPFEQQQLLSAVQRALQKKQTERSQ